MEICINLNDQDKKSHQNDLNIQKEDDIEDEEELQGYDHEPGLEFDDSELEQNDSCYHVEEMNGPNKLSQDSTNNFLDLECESPSNFTFLDSPTDLLEENFEEAFNTLSNNFFKVEEDSDFSDIAQYGIVEVAGDDNYARKVITINACRLPSNKIIDHNRLLKYLMYTLDQYVENDYTLVYFHYGLNSSNKPNLVWLWQAYRTLDRKYKKNLKSLNLVHPTNFIRIVWQIFKPVISVKFGKKIRYVNYLHELEPHINLDQLFIPKEVIEHNNRLLESSKRASWFNGSSLKRVKNEKRKIETQQFGVSLSFIKEHNNGDVIPRVVHTCISYLSNENCLQTEGIFRVVPSSRLLKEVKNLFDTGKEVNFSNYGNDNGAHLAASLLKMFLRELEQPILTYELFDEISEFTQKPKAKRANIAKKLIEMLPEDNYKLLKFIVELLVKVTDRSNLNKMTSANLGIVFGPNLIWPKEQNYSVDPIINFTETLIDSQDVIFNREC